MLSTVICNDSIRYDSAYYTYYTSSPWMFHSRKLNERINHIHERALRIVYKDFNSSFQKLLIKDNSSNIHHRKLQNLQS